MPGRTRRRFLQSSGVASAASLSATEQLELASHAMSKTMYEAAQAARLPNRKPTLRRPTTPSSKSNNRVGFRLYNPLSLWGRGQCRKRSNSWRLRPVKAIGVPFGPALWQGTVRYVR